MLQLSMGMARAQIMWLHHSGPSDISGAESKKVDN